MSYYEIKLYRLNTTSEVISIVMQIGTTNKTIITLIKDEIEIQQNKLY